MERTWHIVLTRLQLASWEGTWIVNTHTHLSSGRSCGRAWASDGPSQRFSHAPQFCCLSFLSPKEFVASHATQKLMNLMTGRAVTPLTRRMGAFCGRTNSRRLFLGYPEGLAYPDWRVGERRRTSLSTSRWTACNKAPFEGYGKQSARWSCIMLPPWKIKQLLSLKL